MGDANSATAEVTPDTAPDSADERLRRWRLVLGGESGAEGTGCALAGADAGMDAALGALYGGDGKSGDMSRTDGISRTGGLGASAPGVARWLG
ncbi:hypothetical protein ACFU99_29870, partial [Streptomyces sp. NPDC057654]